MCGIAGFVLPRSDSAEGLTRTVQTMAAAISYRGPDDSGEWVDAASGVALGFRRLAIIDLSERGHQPMLSADGRFVIVFNGEMYNFLDLRAELDRKGYRFAGDSDTEVLLAAVAEWGLLEACRRAVGMFAFALWDRRERVLHLARDRLGKKPLHCGTSGGAFLFASELKAIRVFPGFTGEVDRDVLAEYLRYTYVPEGRSIYRGLFKLPPGSVLSVPVARCVDIASLTDAAPFLQRYWDFAEAARAGLAARELSEQDGLAALRRVLSEAVGQRLVADVPLGAFLSGGIDSSLVVALMQERSSRPVRTFTIGFSDPAFDEAPHAAAVARHLGTDHTEVYLDTADAQAIVPELGAIYDEPFADPSQIPTLLISRETRREVTVALTGDGGDEVFGGYRRYLTTEAAWRQLGRLPAAVRSGLAGALERAPLDGVEAVLGLRRDRDGRRLRERAVKLSETLAAADRLDFYRRKVSAWQRPESVVRGARSLAPSDASVPASADFIEAMMWADTVGYLPDDILVKLDRASMSASLEARCPLLDHRVVELAWRLPLSMKIRAGRGKWALRRLLQDYVPAALIDRPKQGFTPPVAAWLRGPLRDWAEDLLDPARLGAEGFFEPGVIRPLWEEHASGERGWANRLWPVLMFNAWLRTQKSTAIAPSYAAPVAR